MHLEAVTTSKAERRVERHRALRVAARLGVPFVPRARIGRRSEGVYVVAAEGEWVRMGGGRRLFVHPGLWIQKLRVGPRHPLLTAVAPDAERTDTGDLAGLTVVDATLGLAQDALHLAAFGARVIGLERQAVLGCLAQGALRTARAQGLPWAEAAARVRAVIGDHLDALPLFGARSVDVVFFDPMFPSPAAAAPDYDLFRLAAHPSGLRPEALEAALWVARRRVVVKAPAGSPPPDGSLAWIRHPTRAFDLWICAGANARLA